MAKCYEDDSPIRSEWSVADGMDHALSVVHAAKAR